MSPKKISETLKNKKSYLAKAYNINRLGFFGSTARGEATPQSDIDIVVEFSKPIGLLKFIELENVLSKLLKKRVDLTTRKALKPFIKAKILNETIYV